MKFKFDEIITKANERKDQLQVLSELLDDCPAHHENFLALLTYFNQLDQAFKALDDEGKAMLPRGIYRTLMYIGNVIVLMHRFNVESTPNGKLGFSIVNAEVKAYS